MKALIQRVSEASVNIESKTYSKVHYGMCIFLGIKKNDTTINVYHLVDKIIKLRIFSDLDGKMNKSIQDISGDILVVSQFTLYADCTGGNRPSFQNSANKLNASPLYELFINLLKEKKINVQSGKFGANMNIKLKNEGPVTLMLEI